MKYRQCEAGGDDGRYGDIDEGHDTEKWWQGINEQGYRDTDG